MEVLTAKQGKEVAEEAGENGGGGGGTAYRHKDFESEETYVIFRFREARNPNIYDCK